MDSIRELYLFNKFNSFNNEQVKKFADDDALLWSRYLVYKRKGKKVEFYCTHCRQTYTIIPDVNIKHNQGYVCEKCGSECCAKSAGYSSKSIYDRAYFTTFMKSPREDAVLCMGVVATRDYREGYYNIETKLEPVARYYFSFKECHMWKRTWWTGYDCIMGTDKEPWEKRKSCFTLANAGGTWVGTLPAYEDWESLHAASKKTSIKYAINVIKNYWYKNESVIEKLYRFLKHPEIEYLYKAGFLQMVKRLINGERTAGAINWKATRMDKMMRITSQDIHNLKEYKSELDFYDLRIIQAISPKGKIIDMEKVEQIKGFFYYAGLKATKVLKYTSYEKLINYLKKQVSKSKYHSEREAAGDLYDYICECEQLEYDMIDERLLLPSDLRKAHLQTSKLIVVKANKAIDMNIENRFIKLNEEYGYENEQFIIIPARSSAELIEESNTLGHCVKNYIDRYARGEVVLLFVRRKSEQEKPYYTMEYRNKRFVQCRGKGNDSFETDKNELLIKFIKDYQNYLSTSNEESRKAS